VSAAPPTERPLSPAASNILTALPSDEQGAPYDRHAALYDRLIGSRRYNRLIWGASIDGYAAFAREAVALSGGPFLDVACGTAVFTAPVYRDATRPLVLVDRSLGMLERAARRLGDADATLIQADALDLPFEAGSFETVLSLSLLHVLDEPWAALESLAAQVAPGGRLFASMLVSDRGGITRPYMAALHRRGELGSPRTAADLEAAARRILGDDATVERDGAMAYLRAGRPT
jgi:SAM-dependent methyltransferase